MANFTHDDVDRLVKTMTADNTSGLQTADQLLTGAPLKREDLDPTIRTLEWQLQDLNFLMKIPKASVGNNVFSYNMQVSYGGNNANPFGTFSDGETDIPQPKDGQNVRRTGVTKHTFEVGHVSKILQVINNNQVDPVAQQQNNLLMRLMESRSRNLYFSDEATLGSVAYDGIFAQHRKGNGLDWTSLAQYYDSDYVIDLRGNPLTPEVINDASVSIFKGHGTATHLFTGPDAINKLNQTGFDKVRFGLGAGVSDPNTLSNILFKTIPTPFGSVQLETEKKLAEASLARGLADSATAPEAPAAPEADGVAPATVVAGQGRYSVSEGGSFTYAVAAVNNRGISAMTVLGAAQTVGAGDAVDLKFTAGSGNPTYGYIIYRSLDGVSNSFYPIFHISALELGSGYDGGAAGIVRDTGRSLPGTEVAFLAELRDITMEMKQLIPPTRFQGAFPGLSGADQFLDRYLIMVSETPVLYRPKCMVKFVNVGK